MWREVNVLVVDDDQSRRHDLKVILDFLGQPAVTTGYRDWQNAAADSGKSPEDFVAVVFVECSERKGLKQRLQQVWEWDKACPVILGGEHQTLAEDWERYLKHMVIGSLSLPPTYAKLLDILHRAEHYREAISADKQDSGGGRPAHLFRSLVGSSRKVQDLRKVMGQVADKEITVLITGEAGTGKEVVARNLHYQSPRTKGPFVPVDCGAIPTELLETELFGYEKDAFTGANTARAGRLELAEGGTLFLAGIENLPMSTQVKIHRVLQEDTYERVGGTAGSKADVRIIAATTQNLEAMIVEGKFHEDLFYRLNAFSIEMPALRERSEDVPLLINELVSRLEGEKRGSIRFNSAAIMSLCKHYWGGNVRELANLVERMAIMHPYGVVGVTDLPPKYRHVDASDEDPDGSQTVESVTPGYQPSMVSMADRALLPESGIDLKEYLTSLERNLIQQALADTGGVVARAADHLAIRRTTLVEKMRKYGLQK
ncbi:MAG: sigma-54 dependent transcriptional regulator [Cellvibrionaceae bacterium]